MNDDLKEADIKRQICEWLETQKTKCFFWVQSAGKIPGRRGNSRFQKKGIPDILGIWSNAPLAIEVKRPSGILSEEQRLFLNEWNKRGGIGFVATSLEEVQKQLL